MESKPAWDDLRVLLALHRHKSLLAAGRELGISTSTTARRIDALEAALGRTIVQRTSTGTIIEPSALGLVALAEQLELGLSAARREPGGAKLAGSVRISCGEGFLRHVTQVLADLHRQHPELAFELTSETRLVDLARREADIGIRKVASRSQALIERNVGSLGFALYAAPSYVDRRLRVARLAKRDFVRQGFVGYEGALMQTPHMRWLTARGAASFPFRTTSDTAYQEATEEGIGIGLLPEAVGSTSTRLVRISTEGAPPRLPVYLTFHRELRRVPRVRVVLDAFATAFQRSLR